MKSYIQIKRYGIALLFGLMASTQTVTAASKASSGDYFVDSYYQPSERAPAQHKLLKEHRKPQSILRATLIEIIQRTYVAFTQINIVTFILGYLSSSLFSVVLNWGLEQVLLHMEVESGSSSQNSSKGLSIQFGDLKNFFIKGLFFFIISFFKTVTESIVLGGIKRPSHPAMSMLYKILLVILLTPLSFIGIYAPWWASLLVYAGICVVTGVLTRKKEQKMTVVVISSLCCSVIPLFVIKFLWWIFTVSKDPGVILLLTTSGINMKDTKKREMEILQIMTSYGSLTFVMFWQMVKGVLYKKDNKISRSYVFQGEILDSIRGFIDQMMQSVKGQLSANASNISSIRTYIDGFLSFIERYFGNEGVMAVKSTGYNLVVVIAKQLSLSPSP